MSNRFLKQNSPGRSGDGSKQYNHEYQSLLDHSDESDDEGTSKAVSLPLQLKKSSTQFLEYVVQPEDTLQSIALRFNCSVAQIKHVNTILRDNEIFALRTLRVPVPQYSVLRDSVAGVHSGYGGSKSSDTSKAGTANNITTAILVSIDEETNKCTLNQKDNGGNLSDEGLHNPLKVPIPAPFQPKLQLETESPTVDLHQPQSNDQHSNLFHCSGVDGGLSWLALVLCSLVLGFAGPLIYIFFLYERQQEKNELSP